jgi:hypothetical protein
LQNPNDFDPNKGPVLNPAAFEPLDAFQPAGSCPTCTGVFGYTGSGPRVLNIRGPHYQNVDFALTKNTRISERVNFQFRAEFYNAFNYHVFVDDSNFNISNGNGGSLHTDVSDPSSAMVWQCQRTTTYSIGGATGVLISASTRGPCAGTFTQGLLLFGPTFSFDHRHYAVDSWSRDNLLLPARPLDFHVIDNRCAA